MCADVLEHLRDPKPLLSLLPQFLNDSGCVMVSLPNATHLTVVASLMAGRFPYQSKGLLDTTHLRFFGRDDIDALLRECGLLWQQWETVQVDPAQAELSHFWNQLEASEQEFLRAKCADGLVYQHVVKSYPSHAAGQVLKLQKDLEDAAEFSKSQAAEIQALKTDIEQLHSKHIEAVQALAEKAPLAEAAVVLAQEKAALDAHMASLQAVLQNTQATLAWTEDQLKNHQASLSEVLNSASWKMTKPFRALGGK
jgi:hypothetical protein